MPDQIKCAVCHRPYPITDTPFQCLCGGNFEYHHLPPFKVGSIDQKQRGVWKYASMFDLDSGSPQISLGEGDTPLLKSNINGHPVFLKMESQNPTGSFKDRGTCVLVSFLLSRDVREVVEDSSGNAGASLAAYAAKAGIKANIYAPETTSGPKSTQIQVYGAHLNRIPGPRSEAARAVLEAVAKGSVYASHAFMPFGLAGYATMAYEIYESLHAAPGTVIAPVGHGGGLYGIMLGFEALLRAGAIDRLPYYIGVQAMNCSPMVAAFRRCETSINTGIILPTLAEGASVSNPVHAGKILNRMKGNKGEMVAATEGEIMTAYRLLARQGIYCEPTSSLCITPLLNDKIELSGPVVAIVTGSGYKTNTIL